MADHNSPAPMPMTANTADRPLLTAPTRGWAPADAASAGQVLGYESAQPWMLDETPGDPPSSLPC